MSTQKSSKIPKVCQENWLQMSPNEQVRFCTLCQKNVFDFSEENHPNTGEMVCLRYQNETKEGKKNTLIKKIATLLTKKK